jgi:hypothetical protein
MHLTGATLKASTFGAVALVLAGAVAAIVPIPPAFVERFYSTGVYPVLQRSLTSFSNRAPVALIDVLLLAGVAWLAFLAAGVRRLFRAGPARGLWRLVVRTAVLAAALYLWFLVLWGLNYRRLPLEGKLAFDAPAVTLEGARLLASTAVLRVNALHDRAHAVGWPDDGTIDASLATAFSVVERDLGASATTVPGRPKQTLLDWYFRPAAVAGMTDPFFLETLVASDLLPFERPFVVAHEWSHLAGFADEGEANFVGWLTCVRSAEPAQYSGWLSLYTELVHNLPRRDRADVAGRLAPGPREDLRAMAERLARNVSPRVSAAGWRVYDRYLKANRIEAGTASYAQVVRLALGTQLGQLASQNLELRTKN